MFNSTTCLTKILSIFSRRFNDVNNTYIFKSIDDIELPGNETFFYIYLTITTFYLQILNPCHTRVASSQRSHKNCRTPRCALCKRQQRCENAVQSTRTPCGGVYIEHAQNKRILIIKQIIINVLKYIKYLL